MDKASILTQAKEYVKETLKEDTAGHDFYHIQRVHDMAVRIAKEEGDVDFFVIELAAWLHDIGDWKVRSLDKTEEEILETAFRNVGVSGSEKEHVKSIILNMSFSKNLDSQKKLSKEGMIVQDADRLDAIGAIGIARCFAYGGAKGRPIYDPLVTPTMHQTSEAYRHGATHSINHFYEKLLLLKDKMNTETARRIARQRHDFLVKYLAQFYSEWKSEESPQEPRVGIGVIIVRNGKVLLGKRKGSHNPGTWSFPGGHLEFAESWEECARREVEEETSVQIKNIRFSAATNDIFEKENKHYITIFMLADYDSGEEKVMEPEKCAEWKWFDWNSLPRPLMKPLENLLKQGYTPSK